MTRVLDGYPSTVIQLLAEDLFKICRPIAYHCVLFHSLIFFLENIFPLFGRYSAHTFKGVFQEFVTSKSIGMYTKNYDL